MLGKWEISENVRIFSWFRLKPFKKISWESEKFWHSNDNNFSLSHDIVRTWEKQLIGLYIKHKLFFGICDKIRVLAEVFQHRVEFFIFYLLFYFLPWSIGSCWVEERTSNEMDVSQIPMLLKSSGAFQRLIFAVHQFSEARVVITRNRFHCPHRDAHSSEKRGLCST